MRDRAGTSGSNNNSTSLSDEDIITRPLSQRRSFLKETAALLIGAASIVLGTHGVAAAADSKDSDPRKGDFKRRGDRDSKDAKADSDGTTRTDAKDRDAARRSDNDRSTKADFKPRRDRDPKDPRNDSDRNRKADAKS